MKTVKFILGALIVLLFTSKVSFSQIEGNESFKKNSIQFFLGSNHPFGTFSNHHSSSSSWGLKAEYKIARLTGISITYSSIELDYEQENYIYDPNVFFIPSYRTYSKATQITIGAKQYFPLSKSILLYGNSEAGIYTTSSGSKSFTQSNLGFNIGGGALLKYNDSFSFYTESIAHHIIADDDINFISVQGGIKFDF